jgi:hypothetical protein
MDINGLCSRKQQLLFPVLQQHWWQQQITHGLGASQDIQDQQLLLVKRMLLGSGWLDRQ